MREHTNGLASRGARRHPAYLHAKGACKFSAFVSFLLGVAAMCGCASPDLLMWEKSTTATDSQTELTVTDLVDHLACELAKTYDENTGIETGEKNPPNRLKPDQVRRWQRLVENNFVAAIDLNLLVTRTEGVNPSVNYVWPLTGAGHTPKPIAYSSYPASSGPPPLAAAMATTSTNNFTLALGFQLNSTADRNVEQDFLIDMRNLVARYNFLDVYPYNPISPQDAANRAQSAFDARVDKSIISGPTHLVDVIPPAGGHFAAAGGTPTAGGAGSTTAGKTSFGSKVDFFITTGVNGGPSLALLDWKIGGGGSSGGGGSGGGGGGGGSSGGGGGGGSQLASYSRMTTDSLTLTLGATCSAPNLLNQANQFASVEVPPQMNHTQSAVWGKLPPAPAPAPGQAAPPQTHDTLAFEMNMATAQEWAPGIVLTGTGIGPNTAIKNISADGETVTLTDLVSVKDPTLVTMVVPPIKVSWTANEPPRLADLTPSSQTLILKEGSARDVGWDVGMTVAHSDNGITISGLRGIAGNKYVVTLSAPAKADGPVDMTVDVISQPGDTISGSDVLDFHSDPAALGIRPGMLVTSVNVRPGTVVRALLQPTQKVQLSSSATDSGTSQVAISLPQVQAGTMTKDSPDVIFTTDLAALGWTLNAHIRTSTGVEQDSKIIDISPDGTEVTLSKKVHSNAREWLSAFAHYDITVTLPHSLVKSSPQFKAGAILTTNTGAPDTIDISTNDRHVASGTIQWSGQVLANGDFSLRGNVNSPITGQTVGQIWLEGNSARYPIGGTAQLLPLIRYFPANLISKLNDEAVTASYWDSIPSCDSQTATQKQGVIDAITQQNLYQNFFRP